MIPMKHTTVRQLTSLLSIVFLRLILFLLILSMKVTKHAQYIYQDQQFRDHLRRFGIVHLPGAIKMELLHKALYRVNFDIGQADSGIRISEVARANYHPNSTELLNLHYKSALPHLFELVLGVKEYVPLYGYAQVPIRFPDDLCNLGKGDRGDRRDREFDWDEQRRGWHIDNIPPSTSDRHDSSPINNFDATVVVLLSDTHGKYSGELVTYPGSHRILSSLLQQDKSLFHDLHTKGLNALPRHEKSDEILGSKPYHCLGKAGDVFILNYMNAHLPTCNLSPHIRYAAFFRIQGAAFPGFVEMPESMFDPLLHWKI